MNLGILLLLLCEDCPLKCSHYAEIAIQLKDFKKIKKNLVIN